MSTLTVQEFREYGINNVQRDHSLEYYINEILPRKQTLHSRRQKNQVSCNDINKDVEVMRIQDILSVDAFRVETFAIQSEVLKSSFGRTHKQTNANFNKTFTTIYKNDNVRTIDRLYRGDVTKNNVLLYGTQFDLDNLKTFSNPVGNWSGRCETLI